MAPIYDLNFPVQWYGNNFDCGESQEFVEQNVKLIELRKLCILRQQTFFKTSKWYIFKMYKKPILFGLLSQEEFAPICINDPQAIITFNTFEEALKYIENCNLYGDSKVQPPMYWHSFDDGLPNY